MISPDSIDRLRRILNCSVLAYRRPEDEETLIRAITGWAESLKPYSQSIVENNHVSMRCSLSPEN